MSVEGVFEFFVKRSGVRYDYFDIGEVIFFYDGVFGDGEYNGWYEWVYGDFVLLDEV